MYPIRVGKDLIDQGYRVFGLCVAGTQVAQGMREAGIETFEVSSKASLVAFKLLSLNKWLKRHGVNTIHCHKSGDTLVSALLGLLTHRRTLFTEHMGVTRPKKDAYHRWVYSHIDQVLSISEETYQRNIKALPVPLEKIERFWLGTDIPTAPIEDPTHIAQIKSALNLPLDSIVIGNVGRVCSGKGQMELLEAFALVAADNSSLHLLLVGGLNLEHGSDPEFIEKVRARIMELQLSERVHLAGFRRDTHRMLAVMDIVCLPNHNEAFGLTAIEAMAAKKAIVGANRGALPEILSPVALLCNPLEPKDIADQLKVYLQDKDLQMLNATLALERARKEFSMNSHIAKLLDYYGNN